MSWSVRLARAGDGAALADIYRPAVVESAISFELVPPDANDMAERVAHVTTRMPWLVCERGDVIVGYVYARPFRERAAYQWSCEVSAYVAGDARRRGIARALYTSLFAVLIMQGYRRAFAGITLPNAASVGLHLAVGFAPVGVYHAAGFKFGEWHDVGWFERALAPLDAAPEPPLPLFSCVETESFSSAIAAGTALLERSGDLRQP